jgi:hypothetical protein
VSLREAGLRHQFLQRLVRLGRVVERREEQVAVTVRKRLKVWERREFFFTKRDNLRLPDHNFDVADDMDQNRRVGEPPR